MDDALPSSPVTRVSTTSPALARTVPSGVAMSAAARTSYAAPGTAAPSAASVLETSITPFCGTSAAVTISGLSTLP